MRSFPFLAVLAFAVGCQFDASFDGFLGGGDEKPSIDGGGELPEPPPPDGPPVESEPDAGTFDAEPPPPMYSCTSFPERDGNTYCEVDCKKTDCTAVLCAEGMRCRVRCDQTPEGCGTVECPSGQDCRVECANGHCNTVIQCNSCDCDYTCSGSGEGGCNPDLTCNETIACGDGGCRHD